MATLDLHANTSRRIVAETDLLIAYRTNPHVDIRARGREAGAAMRKLIGGVRTAKALTKLPLLPRLVALLSDQEPYGDAIARGQALAHGSILNVSVLGNFSLGASPKSGMSVVVTTREDQAAADQAVRDLSGALWRDRHRLLADLVSIGDACADPALPALLLADVADNPGGGARGNATDLLRAMLDAGVTRTAFATHTDPALVQEVHQRAVGSRFTAALNRAETHADSRPLQAEVMALSDGRIVGWRGLIAGRALDLGPAAWLWLEGRVDVVFVSIRHQCLDPSMLEHLGVGLHSLRGLVVKFRGHFRAGFDDVFADDGIIEVDGLGLVTPMLARVPWRRMARPIWPLDPELDWSPPGDVEVA